jgi:hypothetical protein
MTEIADPLGFITRFQNHGPQTASKGDGEHNREQLYPHGIAFSLARISRVGS